MQEVEEEEEERKESFFIKRSREALFAMENAQDPEGLQTRFGRVGVPVALRHPTGYARDSLGRSL